MSEDTKALGQWDQLETETRNNTNKQKKNAAQKKKNRRTKMIEEGTNPKRYCLHRCFVLVSILTILVALNMGIGQLVGIYYETVSPIQYVLRCYVVLLCFMVIMNELEWSKMTRESMLLRLWITRGGVYSFIGLLGLVENDSSQPRQHQQQPTTTTNTDDDNGNNAVESAGAMYINIVAWAMVGAGVLYFVMGLLCLQIVNNRMRENYKERRNVAQHLSQYRDAPVDEENVI